MKTIEDDKTFETAILIIPQEECDRAMKEIGVLAGKKVGEQVGKALGRELQEIKKRALRLFR